MTRDVEPPPLTVGYQAQDLPHGGAPGSGVAQRREAPEPGAGPEASRGAAATAARYVVANAERLTGQGVLDLVDRIDLDRLDRRTRLEVCLVARRAWSEMNRTAP